MLTEASTKRRAGLWCFSSMEGVRSLDRGGIDVLNSDLDQIVDALKQGNNTLKRALADPQRFDGIGMPTATKSCTQPSSRHFSALGISTR